MVRTLVIALLLVACSRKQESAPLVETTATHVDGKQIAAFWSWFRDHAAALRADKDLERTMLAIGDELKHVHTGVIAEIAAGDPRTLVLSADGIKDVFPVVKALYAARPTVPGWTIVAFRQRQPPDRAFKLKIADHEVDPAQVKIVATPAGGKLDLELFLPGFAAGDELAPAGFIVLDHAVGEYDMEMKIGAVEFAPLDKAPPTARSLAELAAIVDAVK